MPSAPLHVRIWDVPEEAIFGDETVVLWSCVASLQASTIVSIPQFLEARSDEIRDRYLRWVAALGTLVVEGVSLPSWFANCDGTSSWWTSLIVEKCNWEKSPGIETAVRLIAFDLWAADCTIRSIAVTTGNPRLAEAIRIWAVERGIECVTDVQPYGQTEGRERSSLRRRLLGVLPRPFRALAWLGWHLQARWSLRQIHDNRWLTAPVGPLFVSYLLNSIGSGKVNRQSTYWGDLAEQLDNEAIPSRWLHLYVPSPTIPSSAKARAEIGAIRSATGAQQVHVVLDSFLSFLVVLKALRGWMHMAFRARKAQRVCQAARFDALRLWPLLEDDFYESFYGVEALANCLMHQQFRVALSNLPRLPVAFYLWENIGWERSLIEQWRKTHGAIIGVAHSTVRHWDLRYFWCRDNRFAHVLPPEPDVMAVNGPAAMQTLSDSGVPPTKLIPVEALRYQYLHQPHARGTGHGGKCIRVIALGDYSSYSTVRLVKALNHVAGRCGKRYKFRLKLHPGYHVPREQLSPLIEIVEGEMGNVLTDADIVVAGAITSAAVEAYSRGISVITFLDPGRLNLSPLRGADRAKVAFDAAELLTRIQECSDSLAANDACEFFWLNPQLPRWMNLVKSYLTAQT